MFGGRPWTGGWWSHCYDLYFVAAREERKASRGGAAYVQEKISLFEVKHTCACTSHTATYELVFRTKNLEQKSGGVGESTGDTINGHPTRPRFLPRTFVVYPGGIVDDMIADDISTKTLRLGGGCTLESTKAGAPGARLGDTRPDDSHRGVGQYRPSRQGRLHSC